MHGVPEATPLKSLFMSMSFSVAQMISWGGRGVGKRKALLFPSDGLSKLYYSTTIVSIINSSSGSVPPPLLSLFKLSPQQGGRK